jgi:hypothetical protein
MLAAAVVSLLAAGGREMSDASMFSLYGRSTLATLSLFIWMLALTARLPNEARAGLLALGVLVFWMLATAGLAAAAVPSVAFAVSPFALVYGYSSGFSAAPPLLLVLSVQAVTLSLLWAWTSRQLSGPVEANT